MPCQTWLVKVALYITITPPRKAVGLSVCSLMCLSRLSDEALKSLRIFPSSSLLIMPCKRGHKQNSVITLQLWLCISCHSPGLIDAIHLWSSHQQFHSNCSWVRVLTQNTRHLLCLEHCPLNIGESLTDLNLGLPLVMKTESCSEKEEDKPRCQN